MNLDGGAYNGSTTIENGEVKYNETFTAPSENLTKPKTPAKTFAFSKWVIVGEGENGADLDIPEDYKISKDITLKAIWTERDRIYKVVCDLNGGLYNGDSKNFFITVKYNDTITLPSEYFTEPQSDSKTFTLAKWVIVEDGQADVDLTSSYQVTKDIKIKAIWTESTIEYTITYDLDGGKLDDATSIDSKTVTKNADIPTLSGTLSKEKDSSGHYEFSHWIVVGAGTSGADLILPSDYKVTSNITLKAVWTNKGHKVTYKLEGGAISGSTDDIVKYVKNGEEVHQVNIPSNPQKDGYKFSHWYYILNDKNITFNNSTVIYGDVEVYAAYKKIHTVTFNLDGGNISGSTSSITLNITDGETVGTKMPADPTKSNYAFDKWYKVENGNITSTEFNKSMLVTGDLVVQAGYKNLYTITFDLGDAIWADRVTSIEDVYSDGAKLFPQREITAIDNNMVMLENNDKDTKQTYHKGWKIDDTITLEVGHIVTKDSTITPIFESRPSGTLATPKGDPIIITFDLGPNGCKGLIKRTITYHYILVGDCNILDTSYIPYVENFSHWSKTNANGVEVAKITKDRFSEYPFTENCTLTAVYE